MAGTLTVGGGGAETTTVDADADGEAVAEWAVPALALGATHVVERFVVHTPGATDADQPTILVFKNFRSPVNLFDGTPFGRLDAAVGELEMQSGERLIFVATDVEDAHDITVTVHATTRQGRS